MKLSKKLIISIIMCTTLIIYKTYAFGTNDDLMSWSDYEILCDKYKVEADYNNYVELMKNPQCIEFESDIEDISDVK